MSMVENMEVQSRPIKWLFDEFKKSNLFVDETFQRKYVWIPKDRRSLIETILLGYPIPEIYLWKTGTDPDSGETKYSIVDGQQRIRSIVDFIEDRLKLTESGLEFQEAEYKNKIFTKLDSDQKSAFWGHNISIRFVGNNVDRESIVKMFLRLNKTSNALNPQELRNAEFNGEFIKAAAKIASIKFWKKHNLFNDADIRRMLDIQFASALLIFIKNGIEDETTQSAINKMYDLYDEEYTDSEIDLLAIEGILNIIDQLISIEPDLLDPIKKKTHLYTLFVTIYALATEFGEINFPIDQVAKYCSIWFSSLENLTIENDIFQPKLIEYKNLSQEGVQKKANRLRRYQILKEYLDFSLGNVTSTAL